MRKIQAQIVRLASLIIEFYGRIKMAYDAGKTNRKRIETGFLST